MRPKRLEEKLIAVARAHPPADHVPYAFEKRVMHHLAAGGKVNSWAVWSAPLWRAALSCVALTIVCGVWSWQRTPEPVDNFSQAFEAAVLVPPAQHGEDAW